MKDCVISFDIHTAKKDLHFNLFVDSYEILSQYKVDIAIPYNSYPINDGGLGKIYGVTKEEANVVAEKFNEVFKGVLYMNTDKNIIVFKEYSERCNFSVNELRNNLFRLFEKGGHMVFIEGSLVKKEQEECHRDMPNRDGVNKSSRLDVLTYSDYNILISVDQIRDDSPTVGYKININIGPSDPLKKDINYITFFNLQGKILNLMVKNNRGFMLTDHDVRLGKFVFKLFYPYGNKPSILMSTNSNVIHNDVSVISSNDLAKEIVLLIKRYFGV